MTTAEGSYQRWDASLWFQDLGPLICAMPAGHKGWHCDLDDQEWSIGDPPNTSDNGA